MKYKHPFKSILMPVVLAVCANSFGQADTKTLFFISNSHLDTQWNWDVKTTINEYIKNTLTGNFALLDKYPHFNFNFEGAIRYMWMKEYYPEEFEKLKTYIANGRWHVSGCSVDAADVMTPSAEAIMRNWLYATDFYKTEFGVRGGYDIMLPDCFGFSYALPSLAKHCGIKGFHTAKLSWGTWFYDQLPSFGLWQGVDGSQIYAAFKMHPYDSHEEYSKDLTNDKTMANTICQGNYDAWGLATEFRYIGPRSDRGGALNDGDPSTDDSAPYWMNHNASNHGILKVVVSTPDSMFGILDKYKNGKYQVWNDELPMRTHGVGAYTSKTILKVWQRKTELLADAAEKSSSMALWLGASAYPNDVIKEAWVRMLWQGHHDGITGTSIPNAYVYSENDYLLANKSFAKALTNAVGATSRLLDTNTGGVPMVVYNPLSFDRTDIVEGSMQVAGKPEPFGICVYGPDGHEVLSQITGYDEKTHELSFIFAATVPSLGYAVYDVRVGQVSAMQGNLSLDASGYLLKNGRYEVQLNKGTGDVASLKDNANNRQLMGVCNQQLLSDKSTTWPAWEIQYSDVVAKPVGTVDEDVQIEPVEQGALRKSFRITRSKNGSRFVQYIRMNALNNRIDFVNEVDWQTPSTMLKANFNFMFGNEKATYDLSLGTIRRGNRTNGQYEVQGHQWADVTNPGGTFGVAVLNDCKYGWDKPNNTSLRLTLIHTPGVTKYYTHQSKQDLGVNKFTYSLLPHDGSWSQDTQKEASQLNQPLLGFITTKHGGALGKKASFISLNTDKVSVKAVKKAEQSDEIIIRVYEWAGEDQTDVRLIFPAAVVSAREVNGVEEAIGNAPFSGNTLTFNIGKYQPKTFAVRLDAPSIGAPAGMNTTSVDLDHDVDIMSYNTNRMDATLKLLTFAYPAEQISDRINADGVMFTMGDRTNGKKNALRCNGQTIALNRAAGQDKLYILAASTNYDGTEGTFLAGNTPYTFNVPYYGGYVGQLGNIFNTGTYYRKDNVAFTASHAHNCRLGRDAAYSFLYMYKYAITLADGVHEITLPNAPGLYILSASLSDNRNDDVTPFSTINAYIGYTDLDDGTDKDCGQNLVPASIAYSAQNGTNESAAMARDMDAATKWCVTESQDKTPWIEYEFDAPKEICRWMVLNAGSEGWDKISSGFKLQAYIDNEWKDIDVVSGNTDNLVMRGVPPFTTRKVRLQMVKGQQDNTYITRIYEFAVYGHNNTAPAAIAPKTRDGGEQALELYGNHPNPCANNTTVECSVPCGIQQIRMPIYSQLGQLIENRRFYVDGNAALQSFNWNGNLPEGIYLYRLEAKKDGKSIHSGAKKLVISSNYYPYY